ncbi:hypothetical protein [Nocardioides sp.]|uniref:hypothetical protein n=1 Tax=Nocardioides sp. TaxID=35761 RepID=UPI00351609C7
MRDRSVRGALSALDGRLSRLTSRQVLTALLAALAVVVALVVSSRDDVVPPASTEEVCQSLQATADARDAVLVGQQGATVAAVRSAARRTAGLAERATLPAQIATGVGVLTDLLLALPDDATPVQLQRAQAPQRLDEQRALGALVRWVRDTC